MIHKNKTKKWGLDGPKNGDFIILTIDEDKSFRSYYGIYKYLDDRGRHWFHALLEMTENIHIEDRNEILLTYNSWESGSDIEIKPTTNIERILDAIAKDGKRWNSETKTIEDLICNKNIMNTCEKKLTETITIPEGVREIEISKCNDKVIIEFISEVKKPKFKVGDKVKVRKGFPYEGRVLTIKDNSCIDMNCPYSVEELEYTYFGEHALDYMEAELKQELFNYMINEHGVLLLESDMMEIERIVMKGLNKKNDL